MSSEHPIAPAPNSPSKVACTQDNDVYDCLSKKSHRREDPKQAWATSTTTEVSDTVTTVRPSRESSTSSWGRASGHGDLQLPSKMSCCQRLLARLPDELDGSYSVSRLHAFQQYRVTTNALWLVFVMMATPIPMQMAVSGIYSIPLEAPERGWICNPSFFLQVFCGSILVISACQCQRSYYIAARSKITWQTNVLITLVIASCFTLIVLVFAIWIGFPVPFGLFISFVVVFPFNFVILKWVHVRRRHNTDNTPRQIQATATDAGARYELDQELPSVAKRIHEERLFTKYRTLVGFNASLLFIYPIYMVGFRATSGDLRAVYILLLPVLKVILTEFSRKRLDHVADLTAASTVFSVELMNAMFASLCMGGATSSRTTFLVLMVIDVANIAFSMVRLLYKTRNMVVILKQTNDNGQRITFENMIQWSLSFAVAHRKRLEAEKEIRMKSSNGIHFSRHSSLTQWLQRLNGINTCCWLAYAQQQALIPLSLFLRSRKSCVSSRWELTREEDQEVERNQVALLREVLALMFMIEFLVLVEYVEAVVPMMLALYYTIVYYGPNRHFNLDLAGIDERAFHQSICSMMLYGALEWLSLVFFFWLIKRRFKLNVFTYLGFVLETHFLDIQGKLGFFLASIISQRFFHYGTTLNACPRAAKLNRIVGYIVGVDFTFQFDWLKHSSNQTSTTGD